MKTDIRDELEKAELEKEEAPIEIFYISVALGAIIVMIFVLLLWYFQ